LCEGAAAAAKSADVAIVVLAQTSHEGAGESHESDVSRSSETRYFFQFYSINFYYYSIWSSCCQKANKQTANNKPNQTNKTNKLTNVNAQCFILLSREHSSHGSFVPCGKLANYL
jgi:hypothetical protein